MANKKIFNPLGMPFDTVRDDIADLTTKSHTALSNIGTNAHSVIDTHLSASNPHSDSLAISATTYAKTTAGQTINVSTAAELTTALANLAAAPSLLGDITIQINANISGNWSIPTLIYNGFKLLLKGGLTGVFNDIATGGAAQVNGVSFAYFENTAASYIVNAYRGKIMMNPSSQYVRIISNTATRIYYSVESVTVFATFTSGQAMYIYDQSVSITGVTSNVAIIETAPYSVTTFQFINFNNNGKGNPAVRMGGYSYLNSFACNYSNNDVQVFGSVEIGANATLNSLASLYTGNYTVLRFNSLSTYYSRDINPIRGFGGDMFVLSTAPTGYKSIFTVSASSAVLSFCAFSYSEDLKPSGSKVMAGNANATCYMIFGGSDRFETVYNAVGGSIVFPISNIDTNYTTLKNPSGATDPSYIS